MGSERLEKIRKALRRRMRWFKLSTWRFQYNPLFVIPVLVAFVLVMELDLNSWGIHYAIIALPFILVIVVSLFFYIHWSLRSSGYKAKLEKRLLESRLVEKLSKSVKGVGVIYDYVYWPKELFLDSSPVFDGDWIALVGCNLEWYLKENKTKLMYFEWKLNLYYVCSGVLCALIALIMMDKNYFDMCIALYFLALPAQFVVVAERARRQIGLQLMIEEFDKLD